MEDKMEFTGGEAIAGAVLLIAALLAFLLFPSKSSADYSALETEYNWIIHTDNFISSDPGSDGETDWINVGFSFPFFDEDYGEFWLSSEGFISFGEPTTYCYKINAIATIPSTHPANPARPKICAFWDDLDTGG
jgi:hypothetical protein